MQGILQKIIIFGFYHYLQDHNEIIISGITYIPN